MTLRIAIVSFGISLFAAPVVADPLVLSADAGSYEAKRFENAAASNAIAAKVRIVEFRDNPDWPTAAYVGLHEGEDSSNSIQVFVVRYEPGAAALEAGYRLVVGGEAAEPTTIGNVPADEPLDVRLGFDAGTASIRIGGFEPLTVKTPFKKVATYVSVSSGKVAFDIAP